MELRELMEKISSSNIPKYMVFFGDEQAIIDDYIQRINDSLNCRYVSCDSVQSVLNQTRRKTLDNRSRIFVVIDDFYFTKNEDAWQSVISQFKKSLFMAQV